MKAVILAGGAGGCLGSDSFGRVNAMTPLLGRPILEHLIGLLRRNGVTQICIAFGMGNWAIRDCFGDGAAHGVQLTYRIEAVSRRTAGVIKHCADFIGEDDVLVLGGDSVCDLDLTAAMEFHRGRDALVTLLTCRHPRPLECGMVLCNDEGRVERILETHVCGQVVTNMANTGIYILSPGVQNHISAEEEWDFETELLPALLDSGEALYAYAAEGYWRNAGNYETYLECVCDALNGKVKLDMGLEQYQPGVWSAAPLPEGVGVIPPCWVGPQVCIGSGSLIGPHTVLEQDSRVGVRALVQRSVLMNARVGDRSTLYGAILCPGSRVGDETVLNEGVVLGQNARAENRAVLMERVHLWPGRIAREGARLSRSVIAGGQLASLRFGDGGVIRGTLGENLGPEELLALGRALGVEEKVAVGCFGGTGAKMLLRALVGGVTAAGGTALYHDMDCAAQAAWIGESHRLPVSVFVEQDGEKIYLHLFDHWGLPLGRDRERKLEQAMLRGERLGQSAARVGRCERLHATIGDYAADGARRCQFRRMPLRTVRVAVTGKTPVDCAIRLMLEKMGCQVSDQWRRGIPAFSGSYGGFRLSARDESGALLSPQQLLAMVALVELEHGGGRLAVPDDASAALELIAAGFDKPVLRLGRDGEAARQLYRTLPWLRDAAMAASRLCARMALTGERLEQLCAKTPHFSGWEREVPLCREQDEIMRELAAQAGKNAVAGAGVRLHSRGGWVYLAPLSRRAAIKVVAEGADLELAAELCDFYAAQVAKLDGRNSRRQTK